MDSSYFDQTQFADNPEPRCPVVLVLDTSGSMAGEPIRELNEGLRLFAAALSADRLAALRVEVALITFGGKVRALNIQGAGQTGGAEIVPFNPFGLAVRPKPQEIPLDAGQAFIPVDRFQPPTLDAGGDTPMGEAIRKALALIKQRKEIYKQNSLDYFRPWLFVISDGKPTDRGWEEAANQVKQEEGRKGLIFYAVGVEGADFKSLEKFSSERTPLKLNGLAFNEMFNWLSKSLSVVAHSRPGEQAPLPPVGWGSVDTSH